MKRSVILLAGAAAIAAVPAHARERGEAHKTVRLDPYIEASQVFSAELSPANDSVTYTQVAAGVDASVQGRNNGGSVSVRYERSFGYDSKVADASTLSGLARGYASIVPRAITLEGGALASRTRVDGNGSATNSALGYSGSTGKIYSGYVGPNVHTSAGDAEVNANYRIGYTKVESPGVVPVAAGAAPVDVFDDSLVQSAGAHVAMKPGTALPVGVGVGGGFYQEDVSNLDQRVRDMHVRGDVTVPVSPSLAAVGGVGYEKVQISARDAVRDAAGVPVVGADGRFVTDKGVPRKLAYDVSGLIWDVGVVWRPSSRTSAEAHVGRRYDSTTYYGSFAWAPDSRSSVNVSVYDGIEGFGGTLNNALANMPTDFAAIRNPVTGQIDGCVASLQGGNCLGGAFGSIRSAVFRNRGIAASWSEQVGRMSTGIGAGYDRRTFIAAPGTVLALANGVVDQSYWLAAYVSGQLSQHDSFNVNAHAQLYKSGFANSGDATVLGASAAYRRYLLQGLSANAAISIDAFNSDVAGQDLTTAAALIGLRYDFGDRRR
jgi:hypothetical protein